MPDPAITTKKPRQFEIREPFDPWSVPVFRWGRLRISIAYSVFLVAAVILGVTLNEVATDAGSGTATLVAVGFWGLGWLAQAVTYGSLSALVRAPVRDLSIGLFGVRTAPRTWPALSALAVSVATFVAPLLLAGGLFLTAGSAGGTVSAGQSSLLWTAPSVGLSQFDSPMLAGAWLILVQTLLQLVPLTRSLGRQMLASAVALAWPQAERSVHVRILRNGLTLVAIALSCVAISLYLNRSFPNWLILMLLAVTIWTSSQSYELARWLDGFAPFTGGKGRVRNRRSIVQMLQGVRNRRRARRTLQQERLEAVDATKLDQVLNQLHQHGVESLSKQDRQLLQRVSERVRKERAVQRPERDVGDAKG